MAKVRKPIPPTQRELSLKQHTAFDPEQGNPNSFVEDGKTNRSLNLSFKDDTTKPFSVGIKDIDEAIFYYFQNIIKPTVVQNGQVLPVPVVYASPEKMKSYQKDGYYRDQNGKIQAPLIAFKRESIDKNRTIANKLDANNPNNFGVFTKKYNPKNAYDNFHVLNNRVPVKTNYAVVMPDYLTITYSFTVFTYYVEQLNKIVEAIEYASDAYWGDPQLFQFRAMIDSFNFQTELNTSDERLVRSTFTVKLNGYIVPEVIQRDLNAIKKFNDKAKILLAIETDVSFEDVKSNVPIKKPNFLSNVPPFTCAPGTVSNSGSTYNSSVSSGGTLILPNQTININSTGSGLIPSVGTISINLTYSGSGAVVVPTSTIITGRNIDIKFPTPSPVLSGVLFKKQIPTQYTSYRTGDVGDRVQTGWFDYTPPTTPKVIAELDYTSANFFSVLKNNLVVNGVSSKVRFVDVDGGQTWSATGNKNLATIDKLQGLMFTRNQFSSTSWNNNIDNALAYSVVINGITYDDWYLISLEELLSILHNYAGVSANVDPATSAIYLNIIINNNFTTANTYPTNTTQCFYFDNGVRYYAPLNKGSLGGATFYVRKCENLITAP
jgi:hypothetical protein